MLFTLFQTIHKKKGFTEEELKGMLLCFHIKFCSHHVHKNKLFSFCVIQTVCTYIIGTFVVHVQINNMESVNCDKICEYLHILPNTIANLIRIVLLIIIAYKAHANM